MLHPSKHLPDRISVSESGQPDSEWLFPSKKNEHAPISAKVLNDWHQAALKNCEVMRFEPYCMRHTALTRLAAYCDVSTLQAIAGHSSLAMTQRYVHVQETGYHETFERSSGTKLDTALEKAVSRF